MYMCSLCVCVQDLLNTRHHHHHRDASANIKSISSLMRRQASLSKQMQARARAQHDVLVKSLEKVAGEAVGEKGGWKIKLIILVGGTCGSVHAQTFNNNLKELELVESKRNTVRKGLVHELLNAQDTVLCSYFAQRSGERGEGRSRKSRVEEAFQGLDSFE
jgi:hypothetical protein